MDPIEDGDFSSQLITYNHGNLRGPFEDVHFLLKLGYFCGFFQPAMLLCDSLLSGVLSTKNRRGWDRTMVHPTAARIDQWKTRRTSEGGIQTGKWSKFFSWEPKVPPQVTPRLPPSNKASLSRETNGE